MTLPASHLGSVRCSMKQDGTLIGYRDYEPFGAPLSAKQEKTRLGFIDKEQDKESSLADHGVRKYDYETGRFMSVDGLWNLFNSRTPFDYCGNNPMSKYDENGFVEKDRYGRVKGYVDDPKNFRWDDCYVKTRGISPSGSKCESELIPASVTGKMSQFNSSYDKDNYYSSKGTNCLGFVLSYGSDNQNVYVDISFCDKILNTDGYQKTASPSFGDLIVFYRGNEIVHVGLYISNNFYQWRDNNHQDTQYTSIKGEDNKDYQTCTVEYYSVISSPGE